VERIEQFSLQFNDGIRIEGGTRLRGSPDAAGVEPYNVVD
jgi:hypothetical protein